MRLLIKLIIGAFAVILGAYLIPGIEVSGFLNALIVAVILALINAIIRPILVFFTIPITIITFGLFLLVINAAMVKLAGILIPGFVVNGFWAALLLSFLLSFINWLLTDKSNR
ncbi:MAG: phage holin family protein [Bacteroidales bacterium]|nr:phage holin family protein [Bacteroidales bacterium]